MTKGGWVSSTLTRVMRGIVQADSEMHKSRSIYEQRKEGHHSSDTQWAVKFTFFVLVEFLFAGSALL